MLCMFLCVCDLQSKTLPPNHNLSVFPMPFETASSCDTVINRSETMLLKMHDVYSAILDNMAMFITH